MEILALYKRPRVFMLDLEKKLTAIKEEFSKKQIEIREVKLKKKSSGTSEGKQLFFVWIGYHSISVCCRAAYHYPLSCW